MTVSTKYCASCGTPHECEAEVAIDAEKAAVSIARIEANRDIEVARLHAGAAKAIAVTEAEGEADHLEGVIEGAELVTGGGEPEGEAPVVVEVPADPEPAEPETADMEPPEIVNIPEPSNSPAGWWDAYH